MPSVDKKIASDSILTMESITEEQMKKRMKVIAINRVLFPIYTLPVLFLAQYDLRARIIGCFFAIIIGEAILFVMPRVLLKKIKLSQGA